MNIMQQIPNLNINDLQKLDEKILNSGPLTNATNAAGTTATTTTKSNKIDKTKKDLFRKITSHLVGRNVSQLFRNPAIISDLHPLNNNSKPKTNIIDYQSAHETGLQMQQLFREVPR